MLVRLLSLRDLREGAESNRYWAWWLGLHRVVITMLFYSPIFLLTMSGSHIVILFLYLYGGGRPRGGPAPPPSACDFLFKNMILITN